MTAKWPPRANSDQRVIVLVVSAKRRMETSVVKTATPVGTVERGVGAHIDASWKRS
jgi:hypothetical protein